ncbi:MAG: PQQ-binding-like beta-propeller repeat protein [Dokdonella sp.]
MKFNALLRMAVATGMAIAFDGACATDWPQFGYDVAHSGNNPAENVLTASNVAQMTRRYAVTIPDTVDSAPVYLANVSTPAGVRNLLFALSQTGKFLAIDAATGSVMWSHTTTGSPVTSSSPAIDPDHAYVYSHGMDGKIHKYQVGDGTEIIDAHWPELFTLKPNVEKANGGLALATWNGTNYLYSVTSGYQDSGDYQGHLTTINLASGDQKVFNVACSNNTTHLSNAAGANDCPKLGGSAGAAIWGRGGAVFDASLGKLYISSGNGAYTANVSNGMYWGDSVLSLSPDGTGATPGVPYDSYTPMNFQYLDDSDSDLGSMSIALLPVPSGSSLLHVGMQGGKDDGLRLINLQDMSSGGGPRHIGGELQLINSSHTYNGAREQSAVWVDGSGATWVFHASFKNGLTAYKMSLGAGNVPMLTSQWNQYRGTAIGTTSAVIANGVLYHVGGCANVDSNCLFARNPLTGAALWSSAPLGELHWQSPIVVNGRVYLFDAASQLQAFGTTSVDLIFANGFETP